MPDFLSNMSALTIFIALAAIGFVLLLVSLAIGDIFEAFGIDIDIDGGTHGPGLLDSRVIAVFVTSFGGFGSIATMMGFGIVASSIAGLAGGILLAGIVSLFARFLYGQQATSSVGSAQLVGRTAQVIVSIAPGSLGQVSCRIGEERIERLARSRDNVEIKAGSLVRIDELAGDSVIVSPDSGSQSFQK
ncbi:MAG TPA: hypothetical protein VIB00_07415 [Pyrinomonadaceae bacterium]